MFMWDHGAHISVWEMSLVFVQIFPYVWEGQKVAFTEQYQSELSGRQTNFFVFHISVFHW